MEVDLGYTNSPPTPSTSVMVATTPWPGHRHTRGGGGSWSPLVACSEAHHRRPVLSVVMRFMVPGGFLGLVCGGGGGGEYVILSSIAELTAQQQQLAETVAELMSHIAEEQSSVANLMQKQQQLKQQAADQQSIIVPKRGIIADLTAKWLEVEEQVSDLSNRLSEHVATLAARDSAIDQLIDDKTCLEGIVGLTESQLKDSAAAEPHRHPEPRIQGEGPACRRNWSTS